MATADMAAATPPPASPLPSPSPSPSPPAPPRRISRLPPPPSLPHAGPSSARQRYLYFAVRQGYNPAVYTNWHDAERQIVNYPDPVLKTFSTRLAAEAYVSGWDGAGRHSLPSSTPRPLREHLAMSFPGAGASASPSPAAPRRQSYHARLLASAPVDFAPSPIDTAPPTLRMPASTPTRSSYRHSMVRISSPLRQEVDEESDESSAEGSATGAASSAGATFRKAATLMGAGGLLSPPQSPEKELKHWSAAPTATDAAARPPLRKSLPGVPDHASWWASAPGQSALGITRPLSPPPTHTTPPAPTPAPAHAPPRRAPSVHPPSGGLWADALPRPSTPSPLSPLSPASAAPPLPDLGDPSAPKFSRSGLKKAGVVMPVAAKRSSSSLSLKSRPSLFSTPNGSSSLFSTPNGSSSSLASSSSGQSGQSDKTLLSRLSTSSHGSHHSHAHGGSRTRSLSATSTSTSTSLSSRPRFTSHDRLASLAETSKRELQLNHQGLAALASLPPPRPAFMMRRSSSASSIASTDSALSFASAASGTSGTSMSSMTSGSSTQTSMDSCGPITEEGEAEPLGLRICAEPMSYADADADADADVDADADADADADGMTEIDLGAPPPPLSSPSVPAPPPSAYIRPPASPTHPAKAGLSGGPGPGPGPGPGVSVSVSVGAGAGKGKGKGKSGGGGGMFRKLSKALKR